jgi:hypothetical protein
VLNLFCLKHATCPVCRSNLNGNQENESRNETQQPYPDIFRPAVVNIIPINGSLNAVTVSARILNSASNNNETGESGGIGSDRGESDTSTNSTSSHSPTSRYRRYRAEIDRIRELRNNIRNRAPLFMPILRSPTTSTANNDTSNNDQTSASSDNNNYNNNNNDNPLIGRRAIGRRPIHYRYRSQGVSVSNLDGGSSSLINASVTQGSNPYRVRSRTGPNSNDTETGQPITNSNSPRAYLLRNNSNNPTLAAPPPTRIRIMTLDERLNEARSSSNQRNGSFSSETTSASENRSRSPFARIRITTIGDGSDRRMFELRGGINNSTRTTGEVRNTFDLADFLRNRQEEYIRNRIDDLDRTLNNNRPSSTGNNRGSAPSSSSFFSYLIPGQTTSNRQTNSGSEQSRVSDQNSTNINRRTRNVVDDESDDIIEINPMDSTSEANNNNNNNNNNNTSREAPSSSNSSATYHRSKRRRTQD